MLLDVILTNNTSNNFIIIITTTIIVISITKDKGKYLIKALGPELIVARQARL